jgi:DNA-directed RNA polymerase specialized sigma24 family protein
MAWLVGIARTQISERAKNVADPWFGEEAIGETDLEEDLLQRLTLQDAVRALDQRSRELVALRYGMGLAPGRSPS